MTEPCTKTVGISQRISIPIMQAAIDALLRDDYSHDFALELAASEFKGANRIKKTANFIGRLTQRNPLMPFVLKHREEYAWAMHVEADRALTFTALINASFTFAYDLTCVLGRYFHAQDEIPTSLIYRQLALNYCHNRGLPNAMYCILPMFCEAGIITRSKVGVYTKSIFPHFSPFAQELYQLSFIVHNPLFHLDELNGMEHSYFEMLKTCDF